MVEAESVSSEADYVRALRRYVNSFRDGHISISFVGMSDPVWPGFLAYEGDGSRLRVTVADELTSIPNGAEILSCDGRTSKTLIDDLVTPFRVNADIPHERSSRTVFLFVARPDDQRKPRVCEFVHNGVSGRETLRWRPIDNRRLSPLLAKAQGPSLPQLGMRELAGVTFISVPTFNLFGEDAEPIKRLLKQIEADRSKLINAPVLVVDVRGNGGGNSGWGKAIASALFGEAVVKPIVDSFDWSVDWRATKRNADVMRANASRSAASGLQSDAAERESVAEAMDRAIAAGQPFVRQSRPGSPLGALSKQLQFKGKVFFLTDHACASACLDFADILTRVPTVTHVGLQTSADSVYIDNYGIRLTDSLVQLSTSLKVYRNRVRGNNVGYAPRHVWPGGVMDDSSVAQWVRSLP
jgi:hypothetical protein